MELNQLNYLLTAKIDELVAEIECTGKRIKYYLSSGAPEGNVNAEYLQLLSKLKELDCCKLVVIARYPKYQRIFNELLPLLAASRKEIADVIAP